MKSKAPLALMELLIMLLVFALAAGLCLQAFSTAKQTSVENAERDCAVFHAQNAAELLKYHSGDFTSTAQLLGGTVSNGVLTLHIDEHSMLLTITSNKSDTPLLGQATVTVASAEEEVLFSLPVAWQEAAS